MRIRDYDAAMLERWLIARGNVFAPNWETTIAIVKKLREEKWLVGQGTAVTTIENEAGPGKKMEAGSNEEPIPDVIDRDWLDDEGREELRMVWKIAERSPLAVDAEGLIELQRAPDFVYPTAANIGMISTECRCGEDLSFSWDEDELVPAFRRAIGIFTECEDCSRTFDPAKVSAKITDPVTGASEEIAGGAAYRFAVMVRSPTSATFAPDLVAFLSKEFGRSFYEIGRKT